MSQTQVSYQTPASAIYERKFDTALRATFDRDMKERIEQQKTILDDDLLLKSKFLKIPYANLDTGPDFYAEILLTLLNDTDGSCVPSEVAKNLRRAYSVIEEVVNIQHTYLLSQDYSNMKKQYSQARRRFLETRHYRKEIIQLVDFSMWLIKVIEQMNNLNGPKYRSMDNNKKLEEMLKVNHAYYKPLGLQVVWSFTKCLIMIGSRHFLLPRPAILMVHNKICDLISVLVMAIYGENTCFPEDAYEYTLGYVKELCSLLLRYKTKAFDIFKCIEGLGIAETLVQVEEWKNTEFLNTLVDELYTSTRFDYPSSRLSSLLSSTTIPFRHELMCLSKIVGHPFVDMEAGTEALHKLTTEELEINMQYVLKSLNYMKQNYIRNYIQQNGRWPPCQLNSPNAPKALVQSFLLGKDPHSQYILNNHGNVSVEDYVFIDILPNMQYHKLENAIPYLKDKTISVLRSKVWDMYIKNQDCDVKKVKTSWAETRCLLAFLIHPSFYHDHIGVMDKMAYTPESLTLLDYLVIRVVPKEKELKEIYRGFGCKTYEYRLGTLGQEKNVMRFLDEFSDEQAMTMSELDLLRRLRAFRSLYKAYPGYKIVYVVIDASKWNNRFRDLTVDVPMSEFLDKIFDYPIFSKTHCLYKKTLVYVPDGTEVYSWDGQAGGIEGQNQDTWVVTYLAQLKVALEGLNVRYHLLCKGDDVRIAIAIPEKTLETVPMRQMKNLIVARISEKMKDFGHVIKIEESYGSCRYFAFSKSASCDHVELPQGFRKIQKCYGASNAFIPTLDEYIAATFSNAHSACKTEPIVIPSYCTALFWTVYYLMQHPKYNDLTNYEYAALVLVPSLAGGFPIIYLHNMYVRAESDLLSPFLGLYMHCRQHFPTLADIFENFMYIPQVKDEDLDLLFRDPYTLPTDRPTLPSTVLRSYIVPALEILSQNKDVIQLLRASQDSNHTIMMEILRSARPFNVKVLATLYSATPRGVLEELLRKFESSRSINELVILRWGKRRAERRILRVVRAEARLQGWRKARLRGKNIAKLEPYFHLVSPCPSESADIIREQAWGIKIIGITMPPMQHQLQLHNAALHGCSQWVKNNHFTFTLSEPTINVSTDDHQHYCACPTEPFVGYTTRTGNIAPSAHFVEKDPVLTKVKNLFDLGSWVAISRELNDGTVVASNADLVINAVVECYTDIPRRRLDPFVSHRKSGTIQHHLRAPSFRESIVPNVLSNSMTRFTGESNAHVRLVTTSMHFRINFLHCFCYAQWLMTQELEFGKIVTTPRVMWGVTTPCEYCNIPIVEDPIIFDERLIRGLSYEPLSILRIGEVAENIIRASVVAWEKKQIRYEVTSKEMTYRGAVLGVLQEMMDSTYYMRRSLEDRYGGYHLDTTSYGIISNVAIKSKSRDIGLTELKRLSVDLLGEYLIQIIAPLFEITMSSKGRVSEHISIAECPPHELPWFGLVTHIFKAGKLGPLVRWLSVRTGDPPPACHNSPTGAAAYIGRACSSVFETCGGEASCVVLSYYNTGQLRNHLLTMCRFCIWSAYRAQFLTYMRRVRSITSEEIRDCYVRMALQSLCLAYMYDNIEMAVTGNVDDLLAETGDTWFLVDLYDLNADTIDMHIEDKRDGRITCSIEKTIHKHGMDLKDLGIISDEHVEEFIDGAMRNRNVYSVEIIYSTLEQCIATVRNLGIDEIIAARDEEEMEMEHIPLPDIPDLIPRHDLPYLSYNLRPDRADPVEYDYIPHIEPLSDMLYTVDRSQVYRILGNTNGSESYIAEVLIDTGIQSRMPRYGNYACIADGIGGACSVFASATGGNCTLLYHTLIEHGVSFRYPDALLEVWPSMIDQILLSHLHQGYSRLDECDTWIEMERYNRRYSVVCCDIELKDTELAKCNIIYEHLCVFYLRNRVVGGMLIARVNMYNTINLDTVSSILGNYCTYLQVYKPRSLKRFKWAYVIAAGHRQVFSGHYRDFVWRPDPVCSQRVYAFQQMLKHNMNRHDRLVQKVLSISIPDMSKFWPYVHNLPSRFLSLCRNLLYIKVNIPSEKTINDVLYDLSEHWSDDLLKRYGLDVLPQINEWLSRLHQDNLPTLYPLQSWTTDTQAHRLHCINVLMTLIGFRYGCHLFNGVTSELKIYHQDYLDMFDTVIQMLPERDQYAGTYTEMMALGYNHKGIKIVFGCYFIRGIHAFLTMFGAMCAVYQQQHRRDNAV